MKPDENDMMNRQNLLNKQKQECEKFVRKIAFISDQYTHAHNVLKS